MSEFTVQYAVQWLTVLGHLVFFATVAALRGRLHSTANYRVAQKKVSHNRKSSLNRIKNRQPG